MPVKDTFHEAVRQALIKDGWTITADPFCIKLLDSDINVYVDLGAEQILAAEKTDQKIAVEVKSFIGTSFIGDFHAALGQFLDYRVALKNCEPQRELWLAIPADVYQSFFSRRFVNAVCHEYHLRLLVFDPEQEIILLWKKQNVTEHTSDN